MVHRQDFSFSHGYLFILKLYGFFLPCSYRLFDSSEDPVEPSEEDKPEDASPQPTGQSYAATVALPSSPPASATLMGTLVPNIKWNLVEFRHMKGTKFLCKTFSSWLEKCSDRTQWSNNGSNDNRWFLHYSWKGRFSYNSVSVLLQKEALNTGLNRLQIMLFLEINRVLDD